MLSRRIPRRTSHMRQYHLRQTRPEPPEDHRQLHEVDRRGKATVNWAAYHRRYIEEWDGREDYVVQGDENGEPMDFYDDYLIWYRGITRRLISRGYAPERPLPLNYMPSGVPLHVLTQHVLSIRDYMHSHRHVCHEQSNEVVRRCDSVIVGLGYEHLLQPLPQDDVPCSSTQADAPETSNECQSPYTLSIHPTAPGTSQGECSYVSPVHPTSVRLYQQSDSEGTPLVYPTLDTIYEEDTPTADS